MADRVMCVVIEGRPATTTSKSIRHSLGHITKRLMSTLLIGFDQFLPDQDAVRILEAFLPQNRPCSFLIWPSSSSGRTHRKSHSESGWGTGWSQFTSEWTRRTSSESLSSDLLNFLNDLPKLINSSYLNIIVFGPAPRSALSTACARALRIALLSLKRSRLIWIDLSPNPPKAATLAFSRTLLKSNSALITPNQVQSHLAVFRPETLGVAPPNTLNILKSTMIFPDSSQMSIRAYNIKSKVEVRYAINTRDCRRALITAHAELDSSAAWISLRKRHLSLCRNDLIPVVQFDSLWGLLFPVTDLVFFVFKVDVDVYDTIVSKLQRFEFVASGIPNSSVRDEPFSFSGEMLSGLNSIACQAEIDADYLAAERDRDDISIRLDALRQAKEQEPGKQASGFNIDSPIAALSSYFKQIINDTKNIIDVATEIRRIEKLQRSFLDKPKSYCRMAEILEKSLAGLKSENLSDSIPGVQLQMVVALEISRFLVSQDPLDEAAISCLQSHAARLSVMFAGNTSTGLENFLEKVLVNGYGVKFPLTLLELYENMDLDPPEALSRAEDDSSSQTLLLPESEIFTDAVSGGLPDSPTSTSKNLLPLKEGSNLLELIAQESCLKRRRTVSCFSSRLENQVKWGRSFSDRDPKRRRSDSNFLMLTEAKTLSACSLQVLVEASPTRAYPKALTPQRKAKLISSTGPIVSESPQFSSTSIGVLSNILTPQRKAQGSTISESPQFSSKTNTVLSTFDRGISLGKPPVKRILSFNGC